MAALPGGDESGAASKRSGYGGGEFGGGGGHASRVGSSGTREFRRRRRSSFVVPAADQPTLRTDTFTFVESSRILREIQERRGSIRKVVRYDEGDLYKCGLFYLWPEELLTRFSCKQAGLQLVLTAVICAISYSATVARTADPAVLADYDADANSSAVWEEVNAATGPSFSSAPTPPPQKGSDSDSNNNSTARGVYLLTRQNTTQQNITAARDFLMDRDLDRICRIVSLLSSASELLISTLM